MSQAALISIVDDDQSFRFSMRRLLKSHGFAVAEFPSADKFLASTQRSSTACLVADIHMPTMTGDELYGHLVATGCTIPTILITAYPDEAVRKRMLGMRVCCYLQKPLDETVLIDCLRHAIGSGRPPPDAP